MQSTPQRKRRPGGRRHFTRRKVCYFSAEKKTPNYKDVPVLRRFISDWGKIDSSRRTGTHARHQRKLAIAIKRARFLALLPHTGAHSRIDISRFDRGGDRGRRFTPREGGPARYGDSGPVRYGPGGRIPPGTAPAAAPDAAVAVAEAERGAGGRVPPPSRLRRPLRPPLNPPLRPLLKRARRWRRTPSPWRLLRPPRLRPSRLLLRRAMHPQRSPLPPRLPRPLPMSRSKRQRQTPTSSRTPKCDSAAARSASIRHVRLCRER